MSFNVSEIPESALQYRNIWSEVVLQLFEKLATGPIKGEGKYVYGQLKMWKDHIKTNFHSQDVPYDIYSAGFFSKRGKLQIVKKKFFWTFWVFLMRSFW